MIDVIIPVYNVEKYLEKCIKSVLSQDCDVNIILVNDGSTDASGEICDQYAKEYDNISVIHKSNGGLSSARNAGLEALKGEYILFLDSDDSLTDNALSTLYDAITTYGCDAVFGGYRSVNENDAVLRTYLPPRTLLTGDSRITIVYEQTELVMVASGKLFKREIFDTVRFREGKLHEDVFAYHEIAYAAESILCIDKPIVNYLQRGSSITGEKFSLRSYDAVDALFERVEFFKERGEVSLEKQTIDYIYKYLIYVIHRIPLRDPCFAKRFNEYYLNYKKLGGKNRDREFKRIYKLYKSKILRKPLMSYKLISVFRKLRRVWNARRVISRIRRGSLHRKPNFILISTPAHGNLGDQAIVSAQKQILADCGISNVIEIQSVEYLSHKSIIRRVVRKKDVIVIDGGGNLGSLWPTEADRINDIVKRFPSNRIIIFPETAYFQANVQGRWIYGETKRIFAFHKKLNIFLRDEPSYMCMRDMLPNGNVHLCPDIVLYLKGKVQISEQKRDGIFLCMRHDTEKVVDDTQVDSLKNGITDLEITFSEGDTVIDRLVSCSNRQAELNKKFSQIASHKLVVTDRLHGMIFSYITNTPCIAINNRNKKVESQFKWIKESKQIVICQDVNEILSIIPKMYEVKYSSTESSISGFDELKELIISYRKQ